MLDSWPKPILLADCLAQMARLTEVGYHVSCHFSSASCILDVHVFRDFSQWDKWVRGDTLDAEYIAHSVANTENHEQLSSFWATTEGLIQCRKHLNS